MYLVNPTGRKIRNDSRGAGYYGVRRTKTVDGHQIEYRHDGTDYEAEVGQEVVMPFTALVEREAKPCVGYSGVYLVGRRCKAKLFYVQPDPCLIGTTVNIGHRVGVAQDISRKYPGVTPHVHLRITSLDPELIISDTPVY